jgi:hypothetical protein
MPSIDALAERYSKRSGRPRTPARGLSVFEIATVKFPKPISGSMRQSTEADREALCQFVGDYAKEIDEMDTEPPMATADRLIALGRAFLWIDDGRPVGMAAWAGKTPNGIRINFVYTPPELRGRGYASNLVAQLTQRMLDEGRKFCFLFTDRNNPTSNSIYRNIGYQHVSDSQTWEFGGIPLANSSDQSPTAR